MEKLDSTYNNNDFIDVDMNIWNEPISIVLQDCVNKVNNTSVCNDFNSKLVPNLYVTYTWFVTVLKSKLNLILLNLKLFFC